MPPRNKKSAPRSEMRTVRDTKGYSYIVMRFWDDKNENWEYSVYCEVVAKEAARDVAKCYGVVLPSSKTHNVRTLWNTIWEKKFKLQS
jgi:hypothetical protein